MELQAVLKQWTREWGGGEMLTEHAGLLGVDIANGGLLVANAASNRRPKK